MTDAELVQLARTGDKRAMDRLLGQHVEAAAAVVTRLGLEQSLIHDLIQESLLQAWLSLDGLRDPAKFRPWFCGIALNLARNHLRRRHRAHTSLESLLGGVNGIPVSISPDHDPAVLAEMHELEAIVSGAIDRLSGNGRSAIRLYYFEHRSIREIAGILDISESAVKSRLFKARRRLQAPLTTAWQEYIVPQHATSLSQAAQKEENVAGENRGMLVEVADVIGNIEDEHLVIVLHDRANEQILPIWVGSYEAQSIAMGIGDFSPTRPMTYNLMANLLGASGVNVLDIRVEALKESTFYAVIRFGYGDVVDELDARPSDAMALALRVGCPIFASNAVLEQAAIPVPKTHRHQDWHGVGAALIIEETRAIVERPFRQDEESEEEIAQKQADARSKLIAQLFGE